MFFRCSWILNWILLCPGRFLQELRVRADSFSYSATIHACGESSEWQQAMRSGDFGDATRGGDAGWTRDLTLGGHMAQSYKYTQCTPPGTLCAPDKMDL